MIPSPYQHRFQNTISLYRNDIILHFLFSSRDFGSASGKSISVYGAMMYPVSRITNSDCEERSFSLFHHLSGFPCLLLGDTAGALPKFLWEALFFSASANLLTKKHRICLFGTENCIYHIFSVN